MDPITFDPIEAFGQTLLFLAVCAGVAVGARKWAHALTRENAAIALAQRPRRRKDDWHCVLCASATEDHWRLAVIAIDYQRGQIGRFYYAPLCADCHTIAPTGASPERAK